MAGHSHWARIKHQKGAADAKRGQLFSKLARLIISAAKKGGGDADANLKLRYAIEKAKAANMTRDAIDRAVKKGTGEGGTDSFEEALYEGYASGGVAVLVDVLTDNRHRTAPELKKVFERRGGRLGTSGSVLWMFDKKALVSVKEGAAPEEVLLQVALEAGADDLTTAQGVHQITGEPAGLDALKKVLEAKGIPVESAEVAYIPKTTVPLDAAAARQVLGLVQELEELDDVQNTYSNFEIPAAVLAEIGD